MTQRHCISNVIALQIQGWKWRFGSFIRIYNISKYQEKEKYAVIMHSHFSEFNHNAGTATARYIINSTCVTTKLRQNFKVTTFLSAFLCSFAMTMMCQLILSPRKLKECLMSFTEHTGTWMILVLRNDFILLGFVRALNMLPYGLLIPNETFNNLEQVERRATRFILGRDYS